MKINRTSAFVEIRPKTGGKYITDYKESDDIKTFTVTTKAVAPLSMTDDEINANWRDITVAEVAEKNELKQAAIEEAAQLREMRELYEKYKSESR